MATYYWVGGAGNWDNANSTNWSLSSGGAGGNGPPTATDDVIFDSASNATAYNVSIGTSAACRNWTASGPLTETVTFAASGTVTVSGSVSWTATGVAHTNNGGLTFSSTTTGNTISTNNVSVASIVTFDGVGGGWQFTSNFTGAGRILLTNGALDLNNQTITCSNFRSDVSNTRSIAFGTSGVINVTGNNVNVFNITNLAGLTVTGTPTVNFSYSGSVGTRSFNPGSNGVGTTNNTFNLNITAGTDIVSSTMFFARNINFTGFSGTLAANGTINTTLFGNLVISSGMTIAASTFGYTFAATSGKQQITTNGKTLDFPITQNSPGATVQLQDNLTMGSTRTFTLTAGALDLNNLTLSAGTFSSSNSNTRSIAFSTGNIIVLGNNATVWFANNLANFSYTGTPTVNSTYAGATGTRTILHGGDGFSATENNAISFNITAGTDSVSLGGTTNGTRAYVKNIDLTGFSGTFLNRRMNFYGDYKTASTVTMEAGTNSTQFLGTSGTQQITTDGKTLDFPITFNGIGGTFAFQDALTQGSTRAFTVTNGTVQLKNGVTSAVGSFATSGTSQKFLRSTTAGKQATISQASGNVSASYLSISDINATGGATWNARTDLGSKDITNNTGWNFIFIAVQQILKPIMARILQPIILN
jgi:hypothetical protein